MTLAKVTVSAGEDLIRKISNLGKNTDKICGQVVKAGANPVADQVRKNLEANINDPSYVGTGDGGTFGFKPNWGKSTGDLLNALGISPVGIDKDGINVKIGFAGYDSKGVPNALKARAMESGTSFLKKRPFVRPAVTTTRQKAKAAMNDKFDELCKIYAL